MCTERTSGNTRDGTVRHRLDSPGGPSQSGNCRSCRRHKPGLDSAENVENRNGGFVSEICFSGPDFPPRTPITQHIKPSAHFPFLPHTLPLLLVPPPLPPMEAFHDSQPLWDFSASPTSYNQMQDVDFMSLLDKQFQPGTHIPEPLPLSGFNSSKTASPSRSSPSSDDSPSPSGSFSDLHPHDDDADAPAPKRKATDDAQEAPNSKTCTSLALGVQSAFELIVPQ